MASVKQGTVGATAINVEMGPIEHAAPVRVTLSGSYARLHVPGTPSPPSMTGCAVANLDFPRTIPSGAVVTLHKGEADALVAAGVAAYS